MTPFREAASIIGRLAGTNGAAYVCIVNTHVVVETVRKAAFRNAINQCDCNLADGMPIVWYARHMLGLPHVEKVSGPDLMKTCFTALRDCRHFFYGSTIETLDKIQRIAGKAPYNLSIAGTYSPPFRPLSHAEKRRIVSMINHIAPDIIWVGLGAPKQEYWMHEMKHEVKQGVMIGVGAAFDYFVGNIYRPPAWLRTCGLEWLCRLIQEPGRLWKRYFITNSLFMFLVMKELMLRNIIGKSRIKP